MTFFISLLGIFLGIGSEPLNQFPADRSGKTDTIKVWPIAADRISADPLGQYYIISAGSLVRYDSKGDSAYSWSEPQTGRITMIDTGDPMRILVYQKDFNLLRFLNNRLAPLSGPIRLDDLGLTAPLALAISRQGGFWVLDGSTFRIRHIDQQLKTVVESVPLNLPSGTDSTGFRMIESGDQILLLIPGREIQVLDLFANMIKKIPLKVPSFNVYGNRILLVFPDKIVLWKDPVSPEETLFARSGADIREAFLIQNKLLIRTSDQVILMSL
ncbi:MAG: hypothetical protein D4R64_05520 [Porphyromonadaceae bacterium]|nr:MAG: hypothetical protein D4R64_05520 [Porphyromonadaceae bacterium]